MAFTHASRDRVPVKIGLTGVSGSGKTYSALRLARGLVGPSGRIAVIDTENHSASIYASAFDFDVDDIDDYRAKVFEESISAAVRAGYDCLIVDSASHIWEGVLSYKVKLDKTGGNSFTHWQDAGEKWKTVISSLLHAPIHVICCFRSKSAYVLDDQDGKQVPRKVGMAPVAREGVEYEFSIVFDIARSHLALTDKDRTGLFLDEDPFLITEETGRKIADWLRTAPEPAPAPKKAPAAKAPKPAEPPADPWPDWAKNTFNKKTS